MSLVVGLGLCALLHAEAGITEVVEPASVTAPAPPAQTPPAQPEIQRPKSVAPAAPPVDPPTEAPPTAAVPEPENAAADPGPAPASESAPLPDDGAWPASEPVETAPEPVAPERAPLPGAAEERETPPPASSPRLPDRNGRGLMIGSIASGALGWTMSVASIGVIARGCDGLGGCLGTLETLVYLTGIRWLANGTALGLAIPAGVYRARHDATREAIDGTPSRDTDMFVKGGAAALGVGAAGWVVLRIGLFSFFQDCTGNGCGIGYFAGLQTSFALATAGSGLLSYGLAHREQKRKLGSGVQVRLMPQLSPRYSGLSLAGRF